MIRIFNILFLALVYAFVGLTVSYAQNSKIPSKWTTVKACQINFAIPKSLKNQYAKGIDSCVADFRNGRMKLTIDSGHYGGTFTKSETSLNFKEEFVEIDGKKVQLVFYKDTRKKANRKFVAGLAVVLNEAKNKEKELSTFLIMMVEAKSETEIEIAKQIFQSIRFDVFAPFIVEW